MSSIFVITNNQSDCTERDIARLFDFGGRYKRIAFVDVQTLSVQTQQGIHLSAGTEILRPLIDEIIVDCKEAEQLFLDYGLPFNVLLRNSYSKNLIGRYRVRNAADLTSERGKQFNSYGEVGLDRYDRPTQAPYSHRSVDDQRD